MNAARALACSLLLALVLPGPAHAGDGSWTWPLGGRQVDGGFDLPDTDYGAGHRGIDLPGRANEPVQAVSAGRVTFAGSVAGIDVVTVDHGRERSTYQPVEPTVRPGDTVEAGQVLGHLRGDGAHCATACLHLGRVESGPVPEAYLDPLDRLATASRVRLVDPHGPVPAPPTGSGGDGTLRRPVGGPITSPFGPRTHPVTGRRTFHDGTDFGVPCGTPVRAAGTGTVIDRSSGGAYGNRVSIRHVGGLETSYAHLAEQSVTVGQHVTHSTVVGHVGSTGLSTGCHLHFIARREGRAIDPTTVL